MRLYWPKTEAPSILPAGRGHLAAAGAGAGELIALPQGGRAAGRRSATIGA
jgi:hypothetical protein